MVHHQDLPVILPTLVEQQEQQQDIHQLVVTPILMEQQEDTHHQEVTPTLADQREHQEDIHLLEVIPTLVEQQEQQEDIHHQEVTPTQADKEHPTQKRPQGAHHIQVEHLPQHILEQKNKSWLCLRI